MFLKLSSALRREEGSSLVAILIIMLVLTIGGLTIAGAVINTIGVVQDGKDSASSRAAADAGLAEASTQLQRGAIACTAGSAPPAPVVSAPGAANTYSVEVSCTTDPATGRFSLTLVSTGHGDGGSSTVTRAKYGPGLIGALTTMNVGAGGSISLTGGASRTNGNVLVNDGDFSCAGSAAIADTVITRDGSVAVSGGCIVNTHVVASKAVIVDSSATLIGGDVHALGEPPASGPLQSTMQAGTMFTLDTGATIKGNVHVVGNAVLTSGTIEGALVATGEVTVGAGARVLGGVHAGGVIDGGGASSVSPRRSAVTDGAPVPTVPRPWQLDAGAFEWVDVSYTNPGAGQPAAYDICPTPDPVAISDALGKFTTPQVVDWRRCGLTGGINFFGAAITLKTDVMIYGVSQFYMNGVTVKSDVAGTPRKFHLINPSASGRPLTPCPAGVQFDLNSLKMSADVSGIAYSPCKMFAGGANWNGMIYGQHIESFDGSTITYRDMTLPNGKHMRQPLGGIIEMRDIG